MRRGVGVNPRRFFRSPSSLRGWAILVIVLGHLAWVLLGRGPGSHWQNLLSLGSRPSLAVVGWWQGVQARRHQKVSDLRRAEAELAQLRAERDGLKLALAKEAVRLAEADEAVRLLGLKRQFPLELKAARVIASVRRAPFGGMVIDQGWDAGLLADQGLICPEGVVGRVWAVAANQSSVVPLDAYNASTAVMLARSRATGVLMGTGPGRAEIRYVGPQEVVQVGEPVYTSGLDRVFPRGMLVGHVTSAKVADAELKVEVALAAPLDRVRLVFVLPPHPQLQLAPPEAPKPVPGDTVTGGTP